MQGTLVNIIVGTHVWVEDPEQAWTDGQVTKINGQEAEIEISDGKKVHLHYFTYILLYVLYYLVL